MRSQTTPSPTSYETIPAQTGAMADTIIPRSDHVWRSRGYLPHVEAAGLCQSVTIRLADSLPTHVLRQLTSGRHIETKIEDFLDTHHGANWLWRSDVAAIVESALLHFDGDRYRWLAWCVMPNHLHVLIEAEQGYRLNAIVQSWKSFTANQANRILQRTGTFWYRDYFDRYIRNEKHMQAIIPCIENNPVKAGLVVRPELWQWSSARYRLSDTPTECR